MNSHFHQNSLLSINKNKMHSFLIQNRILEGKDSVDIEYERISDFRVVLND